uniref:Apple domain-containing protein n=1 Tax=Plectus sambesii TaxID=2011161 RepID=A0A914WDX9_9BILA
MCSDEETTSTQECNTEVCSMDCTYSDWSAYDTCSVTCGSGGTQTRTRTIESEPTGAGLACDESTLTESQPCSASVDCPVDCVYSEWSDFGDCSVSCGEGGEQSRTRTITTEAEGDGTPCDPSSLTETQECVMDGCPVDCIYGMWGDWGMCSVTCDSGDQERTREVASEGADGGEECNPTMLSETQSCDAGVPCETGDCVYGDWSDFGSCSSSCTGGEMTRYRDVITEGTFGIPCTEEDKMETMSCNDDVECSEACEIKNVDPQSKPSSKGYKAVGKADDCGAMCAAETSFICEAYLTKGPGDQCILYGKIDQHTTVLPLSVWTMYDLKCAVNKTANTSICMWKIVKTNIDPAATANGSGKGLFQAVDATHCQQLCQNNFPMNHCKAFAFSPNVPFYTTQSCYMYGEIDDVSSVPTNSSSTYDLYMLSC